MAKVVWTEPALEALAEIAEFISADKPGAARRLVQKVIALTDELEAFPELGGRPAELFGSELKDRSVRRGQSTASILTMRTSRAAWSTHQVTKRSPESLTS